jgi:hypothetical protein
MVFAVLPLLFVLQSHAVARFDRLLLKVPEHTWGLDVKTTLRNFNCCGTYDNKHLHSCMDGKTPSSSSAAAVSAGPDPPGCGGINRLAESWKRQAAYIDWALQVCTCGKAYHNTHSFPSPRLLASPSPFASPSLFASPRLCVQPSAVGITQSVCITLPALCCRSCPVTIP